MGYRFKALIKACAAADLHLRDISKLFSSKEPGFSPTSLSKDSNAEKDNESKIRKIVEKLKDNKHTVKDGADHFIVDGKSSLLPEEPPLPPHSDPIVHHGKRIEDLLEPYIEQGKTQLCVLDSWVNQNDFFIEWLEKGLLSSVKVLVLDPSGDVLPARLRGLHKKAPYADMSIFTGYLERIWKSKRVLESDNIKNQRLDIRLFDELPGMSIFMTEKVIFCAPHLMIKHSDSTFFIEIPTQGNPSGAAKEMHDHFFEIWKNERRSKPLTGAYLTGLRNHFAYEGLYDTLEDEYVFYTLDESVSQPYQISVIKMDAGRKSCKLSFEERKNPGKIIEVEGKITFLEVRNHLLLSFRKGEFFLEAVGYFNQISFIQIIYLHTDTNSKPRISSGIMLGTAKEITKPSRDYNKIPIEIRAYLNKFSKTPQIEREAVNINQLINRSPFAPQYIGKWKLHYNIRLSSEEKHKPKPFIGNIAQSVLHIYEDEVHGHLICEMEAHDGKKYEGGFEFVNNTGNMLSMTLMLKDHSSGRLPIHFLFKAQGQNRLQGVYNIVYTNDMQGCGLANMERISKNEKVSSGLIKPDDTTSLLPNILFFKKTSLLLQEEIDKYRTGIRQLPHGIYRIYNHGINRRANEDNEKKAIIESVIEILPSGIVRFKGLKGSEAIGRAYLYEKNVHIELESTSRKRIGYFIIYIGGGDLNSNNDTMFGGVFLGTTIYSDFPIGKRVILQKELHTMYEDITPIKRTYPVNDKSHINKNIIDTLAGANRNITGFLRPGSSIFREGDLNYEVRHMNTIAENFFEAACYKTILALKDVPTVGQSQISEICTLLFKATRYGKKQIAMKFEAAITEHAPEKALALMAKFNQNETYQQLKKPEVI